MSYSGIKEICNALYTDYDMQEDIMKIILLIIMIYAFLVGCGAAAKESGFCEHRAMYAGWDHLSFSWYGYRN